MSDNTFARLISQIGLEAEEQELEELRAAQCRAKWRFIRKVCLTVVGVATVGWAYANRIELGQRLSQTISSSVTQFGDMTSGEAVSSGTASGEAAAPITRQNRGADPKLTQAQAHQRDQALLELNK